VNYRDPLLVARTMRKRSSKSELVYERLRSEIISLRLEPGAQIDKAEICERFDVSRQPVSEALTRLAQERLVTVEPQKGTYVTRIRMSDVSEAAFLREALEIATVRRIAPNVEDETLDRLNLVVDYQSAATAAGDMEEFFILDIRFHTTLLDRIAFPRVAEVVESARAQTERIRRLLLPTPRRNTDTIVEHKAIIAALAERNPAGSADAMRAHLGKGLQLLKEFAAERPELFEP
jgi:DNA-binding GntR family transcriptional regulator